MRPVNNRRPGARPVSWLTVTTPLSSRPDLRHLPLNDPGTVTAERVAGWFEAHSRGFHGPRVSDEQRHHFGAHMDADDVLVRGVWQEGRRWGRAPSRSPPTRASRRPSTSARQAAAPPHGLRHHRQPDPPRRGLLRELITQDLAEAAARPAGGCAHRVGGLDLRALRVRAGHQCRAWRSTPAPGSPCAASTTAAASSCSSRWRPGQRSRRSSRSSTRTTRGSVDRPHFYEPGADRRTTPRTRQEATGGGPPRRCREARG